MKPSQLKTIKLLLTYFLLTISINIFAQSASSTAKEFIDKANTYYDNKSYDLAIEYYSKALKIDASNPQTWVDRGDSYEKKEEYSKAISDYSKAIEIDASYKVAWNNRGNTYDIIKEYDKAISDFTKAISLDKSYSRAWYNRGYTYNRLKEYDKAISDYTKALEIDPKYLSAWNSRGDAYDSKEEYDKAISDFTKAISLDNQYVNAWINRAYTYRNSGEYDKAIYDCSEAIKLDATNKFAWYNRAASYNSKEAYDNAISDYTEAIKLDPRYKLAWNGRGLSYENKKEYRKAISDYSEAIKLDPDYTTALINRADSYDELEEYDKAITDYTTAIQLDPSISRPWHNRGLTYRNKKEYNKAISDFTEALKLNPKYRNAFNNRGLCFDSQGEYEKAIADFSEALRLDPSYTSGYNNRGISYDNKAEYDKAILDYTEAIKLNPKYSSAFNNRGVSYESKGEYAKAINDFTEALKLDPTLARAYINIIPLLARAREFGKAKQYYNEYTRRELKTYIDNPSWSFLKNFITAVTTDLPEAKYPEALMNLNLAIKDYNHKDDASASIKGAYAHILTMKGYVLEKLNRIQESQDIYQQSLSINPNQEDIKQALAAIARKMGKEQELDKTPPIIELLTPQTSRGLTVVSVGTQTQLIGRAKDASGIATVKINGKLINNEEDGLFISSFLMKPGNNQILVEATDKQGNIANQTFIVTGNAVPTTTNETPIIIAADNTPQKYYAVLIAENDYKDPTISDLENPIKDARELKTILQKNYTFSSENIDTLYNKSREEIMESIIRRCNSLTENDNLLIFYAGHGIAEKDKFGDIDGYWIPSSAKKGMNGSYISQDDINKALKRSNSKHILIIADACFSGSFTRSLDSDASLGIQKQYNLPSRKIMASGNLEPVPDNSKFIYYLKKKLQDNKEKYLTAKKLFDSFYEAILNNSETSPQYAAIKNIGDEGGEFVFIKK